MEKSMFREAAEELVKEFGGGEVEMGTEKCREWLANHPCCDGCSSALGCAKMVAVEHLNERPPDCVADETVNILNATTVEGALSSVRW